MKTLGFQEGFCKKVGIFTRVFIKTLGVHFRKRVGISHKLFRSSCLHIGQFGLQKIIEMTTSTT